MNKGSHKKYTVVEKVVVVVLCLLSIGSFVWLFHNIKAYSLGGELQPYHRRQPAPEPREDIPVSSIKSWMTFDYLNVVFALDPSYLQTKLAIDDSHYPNVRIDSYAKHHQLNQAALLQEIQQLITEHNNS